jgi:hypothetical protein
MVLAPSSGWFGFLYLEESSSKQAGSTEADLAVSLSWLQYIMSVQLWMKAFCSFWWDSWMQGPWQGGRALLVFNPFPQL